MTEAFTFGPFHLLVEQRELLAHGAPVTIGNRAFEICCCWRAAMAIW
jgi:hypothetical protein